MENETDSEMADESNTGWLKEFTLVMNSRKAHHLLH